MRTRTPRTGEHSKKKKKEKILKNEVDYLSISMHRIDEYDNLVKTSNA